MFKNLIVILIVTIPFSVINFSGYHMGGTPTQTQVLSSILFNILWFLYGLYMAIKYKTYFLKFTTVYWLIGGLLGILGYAETFQFIGILSILVFSGPSHGLSYFLGLPSDMILLILCIAIPYVSSLFGYFIGRLIKNHNNS